ncbi:DUF3325 family protein [Pseudoalteromonas sp. SaAl2]
MLILLQITLQLLGFILLSLSLQRHYNDIVSQRQQLKKRSCILLRFIGFTLLVVATAKAISMWGIALGLVYAFATATLVATTLAILFAYVTRLKAMLE